MYNTIVDNNLDFEHMLELPRTLFYQQTDWHQLLYAAYPTVTVLRLMLRNFT